MIIDGKLIASSIYQHIRQTWPSVKLGMGVIIATDDPNVGNWLANKRKQAQALGVEWSEFSSIDKEEIVAQVKFWNEDANIHGILIQQPFVPDLLKYKAEILNTINPSKDIDGLTAYTLGNIGFRQHQVLPATVAAIKHALNFAINDESLQLDRLINLAGHHALVINHSQLIGRPLANVLLNFDATVTVAHAATQNLAELMQQADIIVTATGQAGIFDHTMVKEGAIVIDVSVIKTEQGWQGDWLQDENLLNKVQAITPVPGGIGPVTIACLMYNLFNLASQQE